MTFFTRARTLLSLVVYLSSVTFVASASSLTNVPSAELHSTIPELDSCRQLILVTAPGWDSPVATVHLYKRTNSGAAPWQEIGEPFPAIIGRAGFAWGIGLHGTGEPGGPRKREGDLKAPAGVFRLTTVFGVATPAQVAFLRLPYRQVTSTTEAIDDPNSKYYNQIVDRTVTPFPDWVSAESMLQVGGRYRFGVMIEHNAQSIPGQGSCIFLHVWDKRYSGTAGCTAIDLDNLMRVLHWLDSTAHPLIVQLPRPEYLQLKSRWRLP